MFRYTVGKNVRPLSHASIDANITAGFYRYEDAVQYAETQKDGLNFVIIFDEKGSVVHLIGPSMGKTRKVALVEIIHKMEFEYRMGVFDDASVLSTIRDLKNLV